MEELLVELRLRTPDEIKKYQKIISNKEAILSTTQEEADQIVGNARAEADNILAQAHAQAEMILAEAEQHTAEMVSEHEIMQQAYQQANEIVEQANGQAQQIINDSVTDSDNIREGAIRYTDDMLKSLQSIINHAMEQTTDKFNAFIDSLQSTNDIVKNNRSELQVPQAEAASTVEDTKRPVEEKGVLNADMLE